MYCRLTFWVRSTKAGPFVVRADLPSCLRLPPFVLSVVMHKIPTYVTVSVSIGSYIDAF
jgi:hypothetical protein